MDTVLLAQPVVVIADDLGGMDADRGHDGRYRRKGLEHKRLKAGERILRLTDPVHPEEVSTRAFDAMWALLQAPGCPQSDQCASDFGGWDNFKKACLGQGRAPRPSQLPVVDCDRDDAICALATVRAHVAAEQGVKDPEEPVVVLAGDFDRVRLLLAEKPRGRDKEVPILPSRRQVITALEAIDFQDAMRKAGMTVLPPARPQNAISDAEAVVLAVEHHQALPTSGELVAFCKANRISRRARERLAWPQVIARARELGGERGITIPDKPPLFDDRPDWHIPVRALEDRGRARRPWNPEAVLEVLDGLPGWLSSPDGPADRRFSHDNLVTYLDAEASRPDVSTVYAHLGSLEEVTAAVLDRRNARPEQLANMPADTAPTPTAPQTDQRALETLLNEHDGPTLPALLRFAAAHGEFTTRDLSFLRVSDGHLNRLLRALDDADAILMRPARAGKAVRYRLAHPLSERAQRYVDQAPALDDPIWIVRTAERSKTDHLLAAYELACQMPPGFTAKQYQAHTGVSYAYASKFLRELERYSSVTRRKDTSPKKKGEGARPYVYEVTGRPPHAAVDGRRASG